MAAKKTPQKKASSPKTSAGSQDFIKTSFNQINGVLNRFESEVELLLKNIVKRGELSSRELRKNFDQLLLKIKKNKLYNKAQSRTLDLEKEVAKLADDLVSRFKNIEVYKGSLNSNKILKDARVKLDSFVGHLEKSALLSKAIHSAKNSRASLLSALKIPSQGEVEKLERKISTLEKRLQTLSQKAA